MAYWKVTCNKKSLHLYLSSEYNRLNTYKINSI